MRRVVHYIGTSLAVLILAIVIWRGIDAMPPIDFGAPATMTGLFLALTLYTASQLIAVLAWTGTLRAWNVRLPLGRTACHVLLSQIGKYIPGNIAQFIGRFALARADGVSVPVIGTAILAETGLLIASGILIVSGIALVAPELLSVLLEQLYARSENSVTRGIPTLGLLAIAAAIMLMQREIRRRELAPLDISWLGIPVLAHLANFTVLGTSLYIVTGVVAPDTELSLAYATTVFVVAWVAGFVVPGAPGGVGIREGILVIGLGLVIGDGPGLTVALMHRGISVMGDALTFGIGWLVRSRLASPA